jgi:hypothetical protein
MNAETLINELEDRMDETTNPMASLKFYDFHNRLTDQKETVDATEDAVRELQEANGKVESDLIQHYLDQAQDNLGTEREDLFEMVEFMEEVLDAHDDGEDLIPFINNYQRQKAQEMAESGELGMGNDPTEVDQ